MTLGGPGRGPIQIWSPAGDGWNRPPVGPYGDHYSATRQLRSRSNGRPRLLLIGESVATGYLYAPWYTPAGVLRELLPAWDVVDLARTNESLESLAVTFEQALQLEPDVVVMWAGNNWLLRDLGGLSPYHPGSDYRIAVAKTLRGDGPAGLDALTNSALRNFATPLLDRIAAGAADAGMRLVVVVPEVNLVDWESYQPVHVLPEGRESDWHDALATGDVARMAAIDDGVAATTWRQLARAEPSGETQLEMMRNEVGVAAGPLRATLTSPMASGAVQNLLREWAHTHRFEVVDVPALIESAGARPDRSWFLDYCHHTFVAIEKISVAVAEVVDGASALGSTQPPGELQAVAALGALMHTDHRLVASGDRRPLLQHWTRVADEAFSDSDDLVNDLVESRLGSPALPLTDAQRRNQARPFPFGFAHGWRPHGLEFDALAALGVSGAQMGELALAGERAWPSRMALRPGRTIWTDEQPGAAPRGFLQAIWPTTMFAVQLRGDAAARVRLTVRAPAAGEIRLLLGDWSTDHAVGPTWTTFEIGIPGDAGVPGIHPLQLTWPRLAPGAQRWQSMLGTLARDRPARLHPVFGEVHTVLAT